MRKKKKNEKRKIGSTRNLTQGLLRAGPCHYHYATWGNIMRQAIIFYLKPLPEELRLARPV